MAEDNNTRERERTRQEGGERGHANQIEVRNLPWVAGGVQGAAYFLTAVGGVLGVLFIDALLLSIRGISSGDFTGYFQAGRLLYGIGYIFYGAHFVTMPLGPLGKMNPIIAIAGAGLPGIVYSFVPPVFLLLAGRSIARSTGHTDMPRKKLAAYGATAVAGYFPLVIIGTVAFLLAGTIPTLTSAVFLMGLGYPLVFGGLGGYFSKRIT